MISFGRKPKQSDPSARQQAEKEALDAYEKAKEDAVKCLHLAEFKRFLESYDKAEIKIIERLIQYAAEESDPLKFAFGAKDLINKIVAVRVFRDAAYRGTGERYVRPETA